MKAIGAYTSGELDKGGSGAVRQAQPCLENVIITLKIAQLDACPPAVSSAGLSGSTNEESIYLRLEVEERFQLELKFVFFKNIISDFCCAFIAREVLECSTPIHINIFDGIDAESKTSTGGNGSIIYSHTGQVLDMTSKKN